MIPIQRPEVKQLLYVFGIFRPLFDVAFGALCRKKRRASTARRVWFAQLTLEDGQ